MYWREKRHDLTYIFQSLLSSYFAGETVAAEAQVPLVAEGRDGGSAGDKEHRTLDGVLLGKGKKKNKTKQKKQSTADCGGGRPFYLEIHSPIMSSSGILTFGV